MRPVFHILTVLIVISSACETVVEVEIPREAPRLVVNAILEQDSVVRFQLSDSKSSLDSRPLRVVSSAEAILFKNGQEVSRFEEEVTGWYTAYHPVEAGSEYSIRVSKEGYQTVEAETFVRNPVPISGLSYDTTVLESTVYYHELDSLVVNRFVYPGEMRLTIDDPAGEENFYEVAVLKDVVFYQRSYDEQGNPIILDTITFRFPGYLTSDDPAFGENNEIFEDVGGARGESLMFSDEIFDGRRYTLIFNYEGQGAYSEEKNSNYHVVLRTLNRDQYLYYRSVRLQQDTEGNPFAEPVPVYNNIVGGYGIFAGFSRDAKLIQIED